jgi:hypothetical protein
LSVFSVPFCTSFADNGPEWRRNDLIVVAVHHQLRHRDRLQVLGEVGLGERDDTVVVRLGAAHHALPPPVSDDRLRGFDAGPVEPVERSRRQGAVELRAIGRQLRLQILEDIFGQPTRIGIALHQQRRHRTDQDGRGRPVLTVAAR